MSLLDYYRQFEGLSEQEVNRGLREEFGRPLIDTLTEQLHALDALLVVDNCGQVLDAAAQMIESLLRACPRLRVLATSREPMGVSGEVAWRVPSLDRSTSVALFVDRAQQARPGFTPDAEASEAYRRMTSGESDAQSISAISVPNL